MTTIQCILSWGSGEWHTVLLACGHSWKLRRAELKSGQLFTGKKVECAVCARQNQ
jgi:hypothetical protein